MSTNMPFLYHTRSISRLGQGQFNKFWRTRNISRRQCLCSSDKRCYPSAIRWASTSASTKGKDTPQHEVKYPSIIQSGDQYQSVIKPNLSFRSVFAGTENDKTDHNPTTDYRPARRSSRFGDGADLEVIKDIEELEDLYASTRDHKSLYDKRARNNTADMDDFDVPIDEAEWEGFENVNMGSGTNKFEQGDIEESKQRHGRRTWTITVEEKNAFQRIFSDIFERRSVNESYPESSFSTDIKVSSNQKKPRQVVGTKLDSILSDAVNAVASYKDDARSIVEQYPEALRDTAAKALGMARKNKPTEDEKAAYTTEELDHFKRLEALREPERLRVETLMQNAKTDVELWNVMEAEVFSLIPKLGLQDPKIKHEFSDSKPIIKKKGAKKTKTKGKENSEKTLSSEETQITPLEAENGVPPLVLYGPLYPSYLLLGLRLFDRSFAKPSALTVSLLPKIKSLGHISHVLGATTKFYNELLRIYHYRLDDFSGMTDLLKEMENGALEMDRETLEIVSDVVKAQNQVVNGKRGLALDALWRFPRYAPKQLSRWRSQIEDSLEVQADEEAEYSDKLRTWRT